MTHSLTVLHEDNHLIAVHKPAGLLTQGDKTGDESLLDITKEFLKKKYQKPGKVFLGMVHRLDRPVTGIVLFAKTSKAASRLSRDFRERDVGKTYWALVEAVPHPTKGELKANLGWSEKEFRAISVEDGQGKSALLSYEWLRTADGVSLLEIKPTTGRKHQIRFQLASLGCPILGDAKYGAKRSFSGGIALACHRLEVTHPTRPEERVSLISPPELWGWPPGLL